MKFPSDGWASHLPMLHLAVQITDGNILELGMGKYSTPYLGKVHKATGRYVLSIEHDAAWAKRLLNMREVGGHDMLVGNYEDFDRVIRDMKWSVVLLDHAPPLRRVVDAAKVTDAKLVLAHDWNFDNYNWPSIKPLFENIVIWEGRWPWTAILSNNAPLERFSGEGFRRIQG